VRVAREEARLSERRACGLLRMLRGVVVAGEENARHSVANKAAGIARTSAFCLPRVHEMLRREQWNGTAKWV